MTISIAQAQLFFLALTRILAMVVQLPMLGGQSIPNQVKLGLGVLLTAIMLPWQHPLSPDAAAIPTFAFAIQIAQELLIGLLAGFAATLTFATLQIAGELMGLGSGFSSSRVINPTLGQGGGALDQLFVMVAMLLFLVLNGHQIFLMGLQRSFSVIPLGTNLPGIPLERVVYLFAQTVSVGIQLALPVMGALLLTDLTLGLLAKVAPQVQVFFLGLPIKIGVSLFVLMLAFEAFFPTLSDLFSKIGVNMLKLLGA
jgi:flagellar biosynthesis protein FliR